MEHTTLKYEKKTSQKIRVSQETLKNVKIKQKQCLPKAEMLTNFIIY